MVVGDGEGKLLLMVVVVVLYRDECQGGVLEGDGSSGDSSSRGEAV